MMGRGTGLLPGGHEHVGLGASHSRSVVVARRRSVAARDVAHIRRADVRVPRQLDRAQSVERSALIGNRHQPGHKRRRETRASPAVVLPVSNDREVRAWDSGSAIAMSGKAAIGLQRNTACSPSR